MERMSAKKQNSFIESVRDAAIGYTTIVLSVVCFLLVLVVVVAGVRIVVGNNPTTNTTNTQNAIATSVNRVETT